MMRSQPQLGFSLVETLVAITILLIVIVGPMTIASQTSRSSNFASEQVTAFFLAQEGIELIEKSRDDLQVRRFLPPTDSNYIAQPWTAQFANTSGSLSQCYNSNGCGLSIGSDARGAISTPVSCSPLTNCLLKESNVPNSRSRFVHGGGGADTKFTRVINLYPVITSGVVHEVRVVSKVTWFSGNIRAAQDVTVETRLFNVYGN